MMGLEILRPWRSVEKISICPVRTGMNLDNIMLLEHRRHLPRVSGDTHALASGETNCKIKEKYDKEQTSLT